MRKLKLITGVFGLLSPGIEPGTLAWEASIFKNSKFGLTILFNLFDCHQF